MCFVSSEHSVHGSYISTTFFQKRIPAIARTWLQGSFRQLYSVIDSVGVVTTNRRLQYSRDMTDAKLRSQASSWLPDNPFGLYQTKPLRSSRTAVGKWRNADWRLPRNLDAGRGTSALLICLLFIILQYYIQLTLHAMIRNNKTIILSTEITLL